MMPTEVPYRVRVEQARQRLYKLLELLDAGYSCAQIARMPEWGVSPQRIQELRKKALALREKEGAADGGK